MAKRAVKALGRALRPLGLRSPDAGLPTQASRRRPPDAGLPTQASRRRPAGTVRRDCAPGLCAGTVRRDCAGWFANRLRCFLELRVLSQGQRAVSWPKTGAPVPGSAVFDFESAYQNLLAFTFKVIGFGLAAADGDLKLAGFDYGLP
jgi:hypothetical protein